MDDSFSNIKIIIIGEPTVGKTSLRRSYIGEAFKSNYIETIGSDFSFTSLEVENTSMGLSLWDLAGQEKFLKVHPLFYKGAYGCIVVFSIVDKESFNTIEGWIDRFLENSSRNGLPIMVIGNKIDLIPESTEVVPDADQNELIKKLEIKYPDNKFMVHRTSAKSGEFVHEVFVEFAREVYNWITNHQEIGGHEILYKDNLDKNIPGAYLLVMNQIIGPKVIATHPDMSDDLDLINAVSNSAVKLISSLDFNDIIFHSSVISSFPWINPRGLFHYIAFVVDNVKARGNKELFVLGVNIDRELTEPINGIKGVLDGLLYNALNDVVRILMEQDLDLVTKPTELSDLPMIKDAVMNVLKKIRHKTDESIKRWYNIPS